MIKLIQYLISMIIPISLQASHLMEIKRVHRREAIAALPTSQILDSFPNKKKKIKLSLIFKRHYFFKIIKFCIDFNSKKIQLFIKKENIIIFFIKIFIRY